jgi:hypothetical protein
MFCINCGKLIDDDSNFCTYCGREVSRSPITLDASEKIEQEPETFLTEIAEQLHVTAPLVEEDAHGKKVISKYDETYEKDTMPTGAGCLLLFIWLIFYIFNKNKQYQTYEEYQQALQNQDLIITFNIILRIIVTIWVVNIARFRNRETSLWGLFAFFFPAIALIFIGQKKRLKPKLKA